MTAAAAAYQVPIVGRHTNCRSTYTALSVAILGRATHLITSFAAQPGHHLLMAIDLQGAMHPQFAFWNAATQADLAQFRQNLVLLPHLAEAGLCNAGKDISMGGVIGTTVMVLETSGCGATLDRTYALAMNFLDFGRFLAGAAREKSSNCVNPIWI